MERWRGREGERERGREREEEGDREMERERWRGREGEGELETRPPTLEEVSGSGFWGGVLGLKAFEVV